MVIGIISVSYMACFQKLKSVSYESLIVEKTSKPVVENKRLLVLGDEFSLYQYNTLATPFLSWKLSKDIFEQPDYYENVIVVNDGLKNDLPEVIIDKGDLMKKFFNRLPELKRKYKLTKPYVYELIKQ